MALAKRNDFFSLKSLKALWNQLHNKPERACFSTVGEVMAWRVVIANREEESMERQWKMKRQWAEYAQFISINYPSRADEVLQDFEAHCKANEAWFAVLSGRRMADLRAIAAFMERCGLE